MTDTTHPVVWFEVLGKDGAKMQRYYGELFGWKINADNPMQYGEVDTGSKMGIPGGVASSRPGLHAWATFYVRAQDIEGTLGRAQQLGGKVVSPPRKIPGGPTIALFEDPEGNVIGLVRDDNAPAATAAAV